MATDTQHSMPDEDPGWHEIENAIAEIASVSKSDMPFGQVASQLLDRTVQMLAAVGGAVWLVDDETGLQLQYENNLQPLAPLADSPEADNPHGRLLEQVLREGKPALIPSRSGRSGQGSWQNPTDFVLMIHPLAIDQEVVGLIEIIQRPTANAATLRGTQRLVSIVCECASDRLRRDRIRKLGRWQARSQQFEHFAHRIHESLDLGRTAYELVNEGRNYLDCDRVSVALRNWGKYRLLAISGVDTLNRRSNVVRRLEQLASAVAVHGESVWYEGDTGQLPRQIEEPLDAYVDVAHVRTMAVVPMPTNAERNGLSTVGVLIAEKFEGTVDDESRGRLVLVANHGALALQHALDYRNLPSLPFARRQGRASRQLRSKAFWGTILGLVTALAIMVAMCMPAEFKVGVRGELQPQQRRDVFAPLDGQIVDLRVAHNDAVAQGDVLLVVDSTDVDLELQRVTGQRDTTRMQLLAVESALLQFNSADPQTQVSGERLAAEQQELKELLASQDQQLVLLHQQREKLTVRSPLEGRVLTWDVDQLLADRPVQRGQALMTVAKLTGPWTAELHVPDDRIGFLTAAQTTRETPVRVTFELATHRGVVHEGVIQHIANRAEVKEDERPFVPVTVDVSREDIAHLRPGATILAQIYCGKKPLGYIWLHDLIDTIREWLLL